MIHRTNIQMPLPIKVGVFFFNRNKEVGLSFDNLAMFNFRENNGLTTAHELKEWSEKNGHSVLFIENIYAAYQSYNMHNRIKKEICKADFMKALSNIGEDQTDKIIKCWKHSESFGYKEVPGVKKKAKSQKR